MLLPGTVWPCEHEQAARSGASTGFRGCPPGTAGWGLAIARSGMRRPCGKTSKSTMSWTDAQSGGGRSVRTWPQTAVEPRLGCGRLWCAIRSSRWRSGLGGRWRPRSATGRDDLSGKRLDLLRAAKFPPESDSGACAHETFQCRRRRPLFVRLTPSKPQNPPKCRVRDAGIFVAHHRVQIIHDHLCTWRSGSCSGSGGD